MAKVHEELSAGVRFGAMIDPSWTTSITGMQKGLNALEKESASLAGQQAKLRDKMRLAAMRGHTGEVRKLTDEYEKLKRNVAETEAAEKALTRQYERRQRSEAFKGTLKSVGSGAMSGLKWGALGAAGGITAVGAGLLALNAQTMEKVALAKSYGVAPENYLAFDQAAARFGLNGENVGDLFEEYDNKLTDYRDAGMSKGDLYDGLKALGVKAYEFAGMNREQQVTDILDRLSRMENDQVAAGLADKMLGGEANKFITGLRSTGKTFSELNDEAKRYILLNSQGMKEAEKGQRALSDLWTVVKTAGMQITGMTLGALSGYINEATTGLAGWFKNGGLNNITDFIMNDAIPAGAAFVKGLFLMSQVAYGMAKKLAWLIPDEKDDREGVLMALVRGGQPLAEATAKNAGQEAWLEQTLQDNPALERTLREKYTAAEGIFADEKSQDDFKSQMDRLTTSGSFDARIDRLTEGMRAGLRADKEAPARTAPDAPAPAYGYGSLPGVDLKTALSSASGLPEPRQVHNEVKPTINVYQLPGEDGNALAERTAQEVIKPFASGMFDTAEVM